jgi:uncharacterized protein (TIGR03000 family)
MRAKMLLCAAPLLAALALFALPGTSQAQIFRYGYGRPYYYPSWYYDYPYTYSGYYYSNPGYLYGNTWSYPYRTYYYSNPTTYYSPPSYMPAATVGTTNRTYQSFYQDPQAPNQANTDSEPAHFRVRLPANAKLWIEDREMNMRGSERVFASPPLTPGKEFTYHLKAQWNENGQDVTRTRNFTIHAGDFVTVDFLTNGSGPENNSAPAPTPGNEPNQPSQNQPNPPAKP